jgi:hypothetical protein
VKAPQALPEQFGPEADHVTPAPPASFVTVAVTGNASDTTRLARLGASVTVTAAWAVTVIDADALLVVSLTDWARSVTTGFAGTEPGAV